LALGVNGKLFRVGRYIGTHQALFLELSEMVASSKELHTENYENTRNRGYEEAIHR
jgi:hypothetical protein